MYDLSCSCLLKEKADLIIISPQKFGVQSSVSFELVSRLNCSLHQVFQNMSVLRTFMLNIALKVKLFKAKHINQYWQRMVRNAWIRVCVPFQLKSLEEMAVT